MINYFETSLNGADFLKKSFMLLATFLVFDVPIIFLGFGHPVLPFLSSRLSAFFADKTAPSAIRFGYISTVYSIILIVILLLICYLFSKLVQNRISNKQAQNRWISPFIDIILFINVLCYFGIFNLFISTISFLILFLSVFYLSRD